MRWPDLAVNTQTRICGYLGDYYLEKGDSDRALFFYDAIPPASGRYKKYEHRHETRVQKSDLVAVRAKFAKEYNPEGRSDFPKFRDYHEETKRLAGRWALVLVPILAVFACVRKRRPA